jgi:quinol monooxygenase YgiN
MTQPVVFISHFRVKEGKLDGFRQRSEGTTKSLEAEKPATVAFLTYLSEDGTQLSIVHVFPDAGSMDAHVEGAEERAAAAYEFVEPAGWEIYGRPSDGVLEMMRRSAASASVPLVHHPEHLAGFLRLRAG